MSFWKEFRRVLGLTEGGQKVKLNDYKSYKDLPASVRNPVWKMIDEEISQTSNQPENIISQICPDVQSKDNFTKLEDDIKRLGDELYENITKADNLSEAIDHHPIFQQLSIDAWLKLANRFAELSYRTVFIGYFIQYNRVMHKTDWSKEIKVLFVEKKRSVFFAKLIEYYINCYQQALTAVSKEKTLDLLIELGDWAKQEKEKSVK